MDFHFIKCTTCQVLQSVLICPTFHLSARPSHASVLHVRGSPSAWGMWMGFDLLCLCVGFFSQKKLIRELIKRAYQDCLFHSFPCKIWVKPRLAEPLGFPICLLLRLLLLVTALMGMEFPHAQLPIRWAFYGHEDAEVHSLTLSDMGSKRGSG